MPLYFFDISDGDDFSPDEFGLELQTIEEACDQAVSLLPDMARDRLPDSEVHDFICEVRVESGQVVYRAVLMLRAGAVKDNIGAASAHR